MKPDTFADGIEAAARVAEQAAQKIIGGRKRTNEVDRHTAYVLERIAKEVRALAKVAAS
jgi:hypothetical protein